MDTGRMTENKTKLLFIKDIKKKCTNTEEIAIILFKQAEKALIRL